MRGAPLLTLFSRACSQHPGGSQGWEAPGGLEALYGKLQSSEGSEVHCPSKNGRA